MANAISGSLTKILYDWEATYKANPAVYGSPKVLGWAQLPNITRNNNLQEAPGTGSRNVQKLIQGAFGGEATINWELANGYFTRLVLGAAPTDGGAGPYTHTYNESDTLASAAIEYQRPTDTPSASELLGVKCKDFTLSAKVGQAVKCKMTTVFADEYTRTSNIASYPTEAEEAFHFGYASLSLHSLYANLDSADFKVDNTTKLLYGLGAITASQALGHLRKYTLDVRIPFEVVGELTDALGATSGVTGASNQTPAVLTVSNGGAGTALRSYVITLANLKIDSYAEAPTAEDTLYADVKLKALSCTSIVYTNNTAVAP